MLTQTVVEHFGGNRAAVARALGVTRSAVSQWGEYLPERMAYRVQAVTNGALTVDPAVYQRQPSNTAA